MDSKQAPHNRSRSLLLWIGAVLAIAFALPFVLDEFSPGVGSPGGSRVALAAADGATLCGNVYEDTNSNRMVDGGDRGVAGALIAVLSAHEQVVTETTTDGAGRYCASVPSAGTYFVQKINPAGYASVDAFPGADAGRAGTDRISVVVNRAGTFDGNNFLITLRALGTATNTALPTTPPITPRGQVSPTALRAPAQHDTETPTTTPTSTPPHTLTPQVHDTIPPTMTFEHATAYPGPTTDVPTATSTNTSTPTTTGTVTTTLTTTATPTRTPTPGARIVPTSGDGFEDASLMTAYWLGVVGLILLGVARFLHKGSLD